jgi:signal transduction histidine kinase
MSAGRGWGNQGGGHRPSLDDDTEIDGSAAVLAEGDLAGASIEVTQGDDSGTLFLVGLEDVVIGRGREATLRLADPTISRRHLQLRFEAGRHLARDLGSPNGSDLDGVPLGDWQVLHPHCRVRLGRRTVLEFTALDEAGLDRAFERQHITERLTAQRQYADLLVEQAEELRAAVADLEQFARVASHDLVEPLRTIDGFVALLSNECGDALGEDGREYLAHIAQSSTRMQRLLRDLRSYTRLQSVEPRMDPVCLDEMLDDALADLASALRDTGAVVRREPLPTVLGDPSQLRVLLQNLLSNAVRFHHPGDPPVVHVSARGADDRWVVCVRDEGIGLDMRYADRVFEVFKRLHPRDQYPGTGIGLAIARRVVVRHGGRIEVESAPGEGASFRFDLPAT